jgi:hypothetical protein
MSDGRIEIEPDAKTKRVISELHGISVALAALTDEKRKAISTLPGFAFALALVEKEAAEMRAQMAGAVYRCAAKAGHDVSMLSSIYTGIGKDGSPRIELQSADLVDLAEQSEPSHAD